MFTPNSKDDVDMQRQLRTFYDGSYTILRQFAKCDESVKLVLFSSFCSCYYCPYLWLDMTKYSARILRVAYNYAHRKILKLHMRCTASQKKVHHSTAYYTRVPQLSFGYFMLSVLICFI